MNNSARFARVPVSADGRGLVSQAGAVLLWETMRGTGFRAPDIERGTGVVVAG